MPRIYTIEQVAKILQLTVPRTAALVKARAIKAVRIGKYWRVSESALEEFIKEMENKEE